MIRQLQLANSLGQILDLNADDSLLHDIDGLGLSLNNSYSSLGSSFILSGIGMSQNVLSGKLLLSAISDQSYQAFSDLIDFLNYQPYVLTYTTDAGSWHRDARLKTAAKSELGTSNRLDDDFGIEFMNPWYQLKQATSNSYPVDPSLGTFGKIYGGAQSAYYYDPSYTYIEADQNAAKQKSFLVNNSSKYFDLENGSPCLITVEGPTKNPSWAVLQGSTVVANDGYFLSLVQGQKLIVSSFQESQYARIYNADGSFTNVYQYQDLTKTNFVKVPIGNSSFAFYVDAVAKVTLSWKQEKLAV